MVEAEEEYVEQLQLLISCFLRPLKMAASSQKPPCTHDEVNSIFLNSETIMFLHQIFLKGLTARMEGWPTLVLGMLVSIPHLCIHAYSYFVVYLILFIFLKFSMMLRCVALSLIHPFSFRLSPIASLFAFRNLLILSGLIRRT